MAFKSIQTHVSDGTLESVQFSIAFLSTAHLHFYVDDVEITTSTASQGVAVDGVDEYGVTLTAAVPSGAVFKVQRQTPRDSVPHVFSTGAALFTAITADANNEYLLYVVQETYEQSGQGPFPEITELVGTEYVTVEAGGTRKQITVQNFLASVASTAALILDLANTTDPAKGSGMVGVSAITSTPSYAEVLTGTLFAVLSGLIGRVKMLFTSCDASVLWYASPTLVSDFVAGTAAEDATSAINATVLAVSNRGGGVVKLPSGKWLVLGTVIVPANVVLDLSGSEITGNGVGAVNDMFVTGYVSGGVLTSNIGTANESHLVTSSTIKNGRIKNAGRVFNLFNFIDGCVVENIRYENCTQPLKSTRSWYSRYVNHFSRGAAGGTNEDAFVFDAFVNVEDIVSVFVEGRSGTGYGIVVSGGGNSQTLYNVSVEGGINGIKITGETGPLKLDTVYLEGLTGTALDFTGAGLKDKIRLDNVWFNEVNIAMNFGSNGCHVELGENIYYRAVTTKIVASDPYATQLSLRMADGYISDNGTPSLPAGVTLAGRSRVYHDNLIFDSASGLPLIRTKVHGSTLIGFEHEGSAGAIKSGTIPFCTHAKTTGTSFSVNIDTPITYDKYTAVVAYNLEVTDNGGTYRLFGVVYGDTVAPATSQGKTVTATSNAGKLRLTIAGLSHPAGFYAIEGIVRHV